MLGKKTLIVESVGYFVAYDHADSAVVHRPGTRFGTFWKFKFFFFFINLNELWNTLWNLRQAMFAEERWL